MTQRGDFARDRRNWDLMFSAILRNIWRQRNDRVFSNLTVEWGSIITRSKWLSATSVAAPATPCNQSARLSGSTVARGLVSSKAARRNNEVTDGLAKLASDVSFDVMIFDESLVGMEAD
ncbi:hypothetical protein V6N13_052058 [Hibiscus sabdariffa]